MALNNKNIITSNCVSERLGNIVIATKGKKPLNMSKEKSDKYFVPYVNIKAFESGYIAEYTDGNSCVLCEKGDIVMVWDGSRSGYVGKAIKGALGSTLTKFDFPVIIKDYAYYFLLSKYLHINTNAKGVGIPHVDPNILYNYEIPIPPLPEQRAIVAKLETLFSELDKGVEALKTAQRQLKIYRQSVLQYAFEGNLTEEWRKKNKAKQQTAEKLLEQIKIEREKRYKQQIVDYKSGKIKDKPNPPKEFVPLTKAELVGLPDLPAGWTLCKLINISQEISDGDHQPPPKNKTGIPFITISNINEFNQVDFTKSFFVNDDYYNSLKFNRKPRKGDILYTVTGSYGIPVMVDYDKKFCFQRHISLIRSEIIVNQKWLYYMLNSNIVFKQAGNMATGTAQKTLGLGSLRNIVICLCQISEQLQIVSEIEARFSVVEKLEETISESLNKSEVMRHSILKKAFEGKLLNDLELDETRKDPEWETADKLLERIKKENQSIIKKTRSLKL